MATLAAKTDISMFKNVAEYLNAVELTVCRRAAAMNMATCKVGGSWRFSRADIDTWIREKPMVEGPAKTDKEA